MEAGSVSGVDYTHTSRERLAGAFVLVVLVLACVSFWVGVPLATLWALSKATDLDLILQSARVDLLPRRPGFPSSR